MSIPTSTDYSQNAGSIISDALLLLGLVNASSTTTEIARRALNRMIKSFGMQGVHMWTNREATITFVEGTAYYTVSVTEPRQIMNMRLRTSSNIDIPMTPLAREEYYRISNKSLAGNPSAYFIDWLLTNPVIYFYPVPHDDSYSAAYSYTKALADADTLTDDVEFPPEWADALIYNLAVRVAPFVGREDKIHDVIVPLAAKFLEEALMWDNDQISIQITPKRDDTF